MNIKQKKFSTRRFSGVLVHHLHPTVHRCAFSYHPLSHHPNKERGLLLLLAVLTNCLVYYGGRALAEDQPHISMVTSFDESIPLIPAMVYIYLGCYAFWVLNYILGVSFQREQGRRIILAHIIGELFCFAAFIFLPTTMARPALFGTSLSEQLLRIVYRLDAADNLFPSIHCFVSWISWIAVRTEKKIPSWYKTISLFMAILVCISTVTVKQHVLADVFSGILLAEGSYRIAGRILPSLSKVRNPFSWKMLPNSSQEQ